MEVNQEHQDSIDLERGRAINAFAKLESMLCWILAESGKLNHNTASNIFYSNISIQPRVEIVTAVLNEFYGDTFSLFWESVRKSIDSLNKKRNKIVHWHSYPVFDGKKEFENTECILIHPVVKSEKLSQLSIHDIKRFIKKTEYVANVLNKFRGCFHGSIEILQRQGIELFSTHEMIYPPSKDDPFFKQ
ncbi:hypothetical protein AYJ01_21255 [Shewanella algae]|uniref:hypothetical protein n=1 Tax=Shewanella algae TaxID=38313 RepID=UPI0011877320|nr:hypothetical protein [Shewanella algae]TVK90803.1 hypothetical protein AYJ01_21255 [Shewanella algae]